MKNPAATENAVGRQRNPGDLNAAPGHLDVVTTDLVDTPLRLLI
jgi:hypothetical protein